jgi:hypothetical protein
MFEELQELSELGTISGELTALRKEIGERLKGGSYAGLLFLIVILLGIQTWLLYILAVKLGAILPG